MIAIKHNILADISESGYTIVLGKEFHLSSELEKSWKEFREEWNHLPVDAYLKDKGKYRFRRYGRFFFLPITGEIVSLPPAAFVQSKEVNKLYGNLKREFVALHPQVTENIFLQELIRFNFSHFPVEEAMTQHPWEVGIHVIRILAKPSEPGNPTPEGKHRDGHNFVAMHLIQRKNVSGGETTIYNTDEQPLQDVALLNPLDSVYVEDARVMHRVTPIHSENNIDSGKRDMLLVTYDYRPQLVLP